MKQKIHWLQYTAIDVLGFDLPQLNFQNVGLGGLSVVPHQRY